MHGSICVFNKIVKYAAVAGVIAAALAPAASPARADGEKLKVVTTFHFIASIVREIGGDKVDVTALARATEDPHEVTATPQRMVTLRDADAFIESGLQMEVWDENVIDGARNPKIQKVAPGHCFAADGVVPLEVPRVLGGRAAGDVHPFGNPHVWFEPFCGHIYAKNIEQCLARVSPGDAETFAKNRKAFDEKLDEAIFGKELCDLMGGGARLEKLAHEGKLDAFLAEHKYKGKPLAELLGGLMKKARALKGAKVLAYHKSWAYFAQTYGCEFVGEMEPKPGIPPTPGHLRELEETAKRTGSKTILVMSYEPKSTAEDFASRIDAKVAACPSDVDAEGTKDFFEFEAMLVDRVVEALPKR